MNKKNLLLAGTFLICSTLMAFAGQKTDGYDLEISSGEKLLSTIPVKPQSPPYFTISFMLYRVPADQKAQTTEGERIYGFQILPGYEEGLVRVEVVALLEDPNTISEEHRLDKFKKQSLGWYVVRVGESVKLSEMSKLGAEPLTLKVPARP